jgi:ABC transport system ATP-binding/permease protein
MLRPNVLLLDEPTNDLDVETLTVLEDYLDTFDGALIAVSHDRYFLDRVVEHMLVFDDKGEVVEFPGTYSAWAEAKQDEADELAAQRAAASSASKPAAQAVPAQVVAAAPAATGTKKLSSWELKELEQLRAAIPTLEAKLAAMDAKLAMSGSDYAALAKMTEERAAASAQLDTKLERWMELEERA